MGFVIGKVLSLSASTAVGVRHHHITMMLYHLDFTVLTIGIMTAIKILSSFLPTTLPHKSHTNFSSTLSQYPPAYFHIN